MRCGKLLKNKKNYTNLELETRFGKHSTKRCQNIGSLLRDRKVDYWGRLRLDVILPIVSQRQFYQGDTEKAFVKLSVN